MENPLNLSGKTTLVTGASSGIGRATAILLSRLGANVILVARDQTRLAETRTQMEGEHHRIEPFDLNQTDELPGWLKALAAESGPLDGVAHCAGADLLRPLQVQTSAQVEDLLRINVVSAIMLAKAFRQKNVHAESGSLVLISSVMGNVGETGRSAYCASKSALHGLTRALALELAKDQIRVNCVAPGAVATEMVADNAAVLGTKGLQEIVARHPMGMGTPTDVAYAIAYLLAETGRWVTGSIQTIDGGYSAQ